MVIDNNEDDLAGIPNSVLAQVSPETAMRLRGALFRGQALRAMTPAIAEMASAAGDMARVRATQTRGPVRAGFELQAASRTGGWCGSSSSVAVRGVVWCDGVE